jgi:hypothetical protein
VPAKSPNACDDCSHVWTPRTGTLSKCCPKCRSKRTRIDATPPLDLVTSRRTTRRRSKVASLRFQLPVGLKSALESLAANHRRTTTAELIIAIEEHLRHAGLLSG